MKFSASALVALVIEDATDGSDVGSRQGDFDHDLLPHPDDHPAGPVPRLSQRVQSVAQSRISRLRNADRVDSPRCIRQSSG